MNIIERCYNAKKVRPKPSIFKSDDLDMLIITTAWGEGAKKEEINQELSKYVFNAHKDIEVTSPFNFNTALSSDSNHLRMAALLVNDMVYRSENKSDLKTCYELLVIYKNHNVLSWLQIGNPNLILVSDFVRPISIAPPLIIPSNSLDSSQAQRSIDYLPSQFFGTESHCHFQTGSIRVESSDKLIVFSDIVLSPDIWNIKKNESNLEALTKLQIKQFPDQSFWMGVIDF